MKEKYNISVLFITEFFPNIYQSYVLNTIDAVLQHGAKVTIVAGGKLGNTHDQRVEQLGLLNHTYYFSFNSFRDVVRGLHPYCSPFSKRGKQAYRGLFSLFRTSDWQFHRLSSLIKELIRAPLWKCTPRFNLVHAHFLSGAYEYLFIPKAQNIPLLVTFHGLPTRGGVTPLPQQKLHTLFFSAQLFLSNTLFAKQQLESLGCPPEKIRILPQGIRLVDFPFCPKPSPRDTPLVLLTVARLSYEKGHKYAIEAVKKLREEGRQVEYRIVGGGPYKDELKRFTMELNVTDNVRFFGELTHEELVQQYKEADIFILPSFEDVSLFHTETQGVVIQEAQASGKLVIATDAGGIPECVNNGQSAFLVPQRNSDALAQKIAWLVDHPENWEGWQREGRMWVENHFSMEKIGKSLWSIYEELSHH